jgi:hypothetical protein
MTAAAALAAEPGMARVHAAPRSAGVASPAAAPPSAPAPDIGLVHAAPPAAAVVRRTARALHAACAELLPGFAHASREPWRQALLTAGCLDGPARRPAAAPAAPPALVVEDVVQPSDVLCALWLARRSGMFSPGSSCGDAVGLRSACDIVPAFAPGTSGERRDAVLAVLGANTAWRAHRAARALAA